MMSLRFVVVAGISSRVNLNAASVRAMVQLDGASTPERVGGEVTRDGQETYSEKIALRDVRISPVGRERRGDYHGIAGLLFRFIGRAAGVFKAYLHVI